jgi:hypothetical protein
MEYMQLVLMEQLEINCMLFLPMIAHLLLLELLQVQETR